MSGISTLGAALNRINLINVQTDQLNTLTYQLASGKKTAKFTGLQTDVLTSKRARADFVALDTYMNNIDHAERRISLTLKGIEEFQAQAENLANSLETFNQQSVHQEGDVIYYDDPLTPEVENIPVGMSSGDPDTALKGIQDLASNIFDFLGDLLNTKDTDRYLMSGAATNEQPYKDTGTLDTAISSLIGRWKDETLPAAQNLTNNELLSAVKSRSSSQDTNAITDTIVGYSPVLSSNNAGDVFVRVDERSEIEYTTLANEQPFRDLMVAAAFIKNESFAPIADAYAEPYTAGDPTTADGAPGATTDEQKDNFFEVFNELTRMVNKALDDMDSVRFKLENARARIAETKQSHQNSQAILQTSIDDIENVDVDEVALKINTLQIQLEASYRVTANAQQLSLVNFI
ncbi:MAG: hypothetical protein JKY71_02835 [Alphaproteobacteria bacterium]|nr:hypothetical protein [Alphaproteobacteria bacterium]